MISSVLGLIYIPLPIAKPAEKQRLNRNNHRVINRVVDLAVVTSKIVTHPFERLFSVLQVPNLNTIGRLAHQREICRVSQVHYWSLVKASPFLAFYASPSLEMQCV